MRQYLAGSALVPGIAPGRQFGPHAIAPIMRCPPQGKADVVDAREIIIVKVLDQIPFRS